MDLSGHITVLKGEKYLNVRVYMEQLPFVVGRHFVALRLLIHMVQGGNRLCSPPTRTRTHMHAHTVPRALYSKTMHIC